MPRPFDLVTPPALADQHGESYPRLVALMQRLLAPDGCPWDREQSFETLRRYVLEEASEVVDAIDIGDRQQLRDELGDLLLQVVFLGELARREAAFGPDDVVAGIVNKLVRRHPHVFGDLELDDAEEVLVNWERIKARERKEKGDTQALLDTVPRGLPALVRAQRIGDKASKVGFDWPEPSGPRAKLSEEIAELDEALDSGDAARVEEELGDVLFALVNVARHSKVDAEASLRAATRKFMRRFAYVETQVANEHGGWEQPEGHLPLDRLEELWQQGKREQEQSDDG
jgi:tetrapyrrole methylase family protein/MazG family protein/ATP diphosphatase